MEVKFARTARKHRVASGRVLQAMRRGEPTFEPAPRSGLSDTWRWIAPDDRGVLLEVVAVERPDCLLVIHIMPVYER